MSCPNCGGDLYGDGYTWPIHCEFVDLGPCWEPDSGPWYCDFGMEGGDDQLSSAVPE